MRKSKMENLDKDSFFTILSKLDDKNIKTFSQVNKKTKRLLENDYFWLLRIINNKKMKWEDVRVLNDFLGFKSYKNLYIYMNETFNRIRDIKYMMLLINEGIFIEEIVKSSLPLNPPRWINIPELIYDLRRDIIPQLLYFIFRDVVDFTIKYFNYEPSDEKLFNNTRLGKVDITPNISSLFREFLLDGEHYNLFMYANATKLNYYIQIGEEGKAFLKDKDAIWKKDKDYIFIHQLLLSGNKEKLIKFLKIHYNEENTEYLISTSIKYEKI